MNTAELIRAARAIRTALPAFNIPYLPMVEPVVKAVIDTDSVALIAVARLEWTKLQAKSLAAVLEAYKAHENRDHVRLHLDHVPVIDEDNLQVDYLSIIREALALGYESVMVDGSRLSLDENIAATHEVAELAHAAEVSCEAELGAVLGHEAGPPPPYEELFASGRGFTNVAEALRFAAESGCDWLSVAAGNIHGAVSDAYRHQPKPEARLDLEHIGRLAEAAGVPLVLHGGSGIKRDYMLEAIKRGVAKVNVATEIRQPYEKTMAATNDVAEAQQAVYTRTVEVIRDYFGFSGNRARLFAKADTLTPQTD